MLKWIARAWGRAVSVYRYQRMRLGIEHASGPARFAPQRNDVVVLCLVRDGALWLDAFLEHYRTLGAAHFLFVDNGSTDGTLERLRGEGDVTLIRSDLPARKYETLLRNYAATTYVRGRWCLISDVDELFDYPQSGQVPLRRLADYLDESGYNCVVAQMLDLLPVGGPARSRYDLESLAEGYRWYDLSSVETYDYHDAQGVGFSYFLRENSVASPRIRILYGGIRRLKFGTRVALTKHPLVRVDPGVVPSAHPHCASNVRCADFSALIRHYKFAGDYRARLEREVSRHAWDHGEDHAALAALGGGEIWDLPPTAKMFSSAADLLDAGFIIGSERLEAWTSDSASR